MDPEERPAGQQIGAEHGDGQREELEEVESKAWAFLLFPEGVNKDIRQGAGSCCRVEILKGEKIGSRRKGILWTVYTANTSSEGVRRGNLKNRT